MSYPRVTVKAGPWSVPERLGHATWGAWLLAVLSSFAVLETTAKVSGRFPTLSRVLCAWLGLDPRRRFGAWALLGFGAVWAWLCVHLHLSARSGLRP